MAKDSTIKTRLTLDGEKEFKQKIREINQEMRLGNAQLKETAAAYDLNGNAQERLTAQSRILKEQLNAQNRIVEEYEQRLKQAKSATDLSTQGLRNYEIELTKARTVQKQLEKSVESTDRELEELGRDSRRAGDQLEDNLGDTADEVGDKFDRMVQKIQDDLGDLRGMQTISLGVDIARGAWDLGQTLFDFAEQNREYNARQAITDYNIAQKGGNVEEATKLAFTLAGIFNDQDSAREAVSNLTAANYTGAELQNIVRYIGGAALQWQDTLKIESLADSLQESLATGVFTGQIAELIERLGYNLETVNSALAEAKAYDLSNGTDTQAKAVVEAYLRDKGLGEYYDMFLVENKGLIDAATATATLNDELAELAGHVDKGLTPATRWFAGVIADINAVLSGEKSIEEFAGDRKEEVKKGVVTAIKKGVSFVDNTIAWADGDNWVNDLVYGEEKPQGPWAIEQSRLDRLIAEANEEKEKAKKARSAGMSVAQYDYVAALLQEQGQYKSVEDYLTATTPQTETPGIKIENSIYGHIDEALGEITKKIDQEMQDKAGQELTSTGEKMVEGLSSQTGPLRSIAEMQREMLEEVWRDPITPTVVVGYAASGHGGKPNLPQLPSQVNVTVEVDKRTLGQTVAPLVDSYMGADGGATGAFTNRWE